MNKETLISLFQEELQQTPWDIKAESQLLLAIKQGMGVDDFLVCCDKVFKREFSKDVISADLKDDAKKQSFLEFHLSRTGLYDQFPEGLFFQIAQRESRYLTTDDMVLDYKQNSKKEEEIRRFFLPFDNDFFLQRLQLEQEETMLLEGLRSGILNDYFIRFWDLPAAIPKAFMAPLILLLPHAHKIAGDLKLTSQGLGYLLKEDVNLVQKFAPVCSAGSVPLLLGSGLLGVDMVCGDEFFEDNPVIEIEIGPLKNSHVKDYLEGGKRFVLLETFNRFFIPAGLDTITTVKVSSEKQDMLLERGAEPVLGYSTVLG